ncbi:GNAT family N-acetyltransferase [Pseudooceanicola sp. C21-150M6]|uniref:GNAT family N-acetyltransferase n=1 Tax=Pseudooceanicola sp. C21-150M6 TaxID=3434355 RepID=UPI003D7FC93C
MPRPDPEFSVRLARDAADLEAAQHLRYRVFIQELGGNGALVDHEAELEKDRFDPEFDHLLLLDASRGGSVRDQIVGVYRLLDQAGADRIGQFYSEDEYDLTPLRQSGRRLLELGRSCLHADYRGGTGMFHLWSALSDYIAERGIELLFGTASFHGTDVTALAEPLSLLHHRHLAPPELRVRAAPGAYESMDLIAEQDLDRLSAMRAMPALIKGYLRLGAMVGDGAYVDHDFNTTDVCIIIDTAAMSAAQARLYGGRGR